MGSTQLDCPCLDFSVTYFILLLCYISESSKILEVCIHICISERGKSPFVPLLLSSSTIIAVKGVQLSM